MGEQLFQNNSIFMTMVRRLLAHISRGQLSWLRLHGGLADPGYKIFFWKIGNIYWLSFFLLLLPFLFLIFEIQEFPRSQKYMEAYKKSATFCSSDISKHIWPLNVHQVDIISSSGKRKVCLRKVCSRESGFILFQWFCFIWHLIFAKIMTVWTLQFDFCKSWQDGFQMILSEYYLV